MDNSRNTSKPANVSEEDWKMIQEMSEMWRNTAERAEKREMEGLDELTQYFKNMNAKEKEKNIKSQNKLQNEIICGMAKSPSFEEDEKKTVNLRINDRIYRGVPTNIADAIKLLLRDYEVKKESSKYENHKDIPGHDKCDKLREIRKMVAEANGIDYEPRQCTNLNPCKGTCPVCESEVRYIERRLREKTEAGEEVYLRGIAENVFSGISAFNELVEGEENEDYDF